MLFFLGFNAVMLLLALGVLTKLVSVKLMSGFITGLHYTVGISTPTPDQVRRAVLIWIVSVVTIVDVLFALLRWAF
jgi:hypothetical protein